MILSALMALAPLANDPGAGTSTTTFLAQGSPPRELLGTSVDMDVSLAAVGVPSNAGIFGFDAGAGRVHVYRPAGGGQWKRVATLSPADGSADDRFGASVAVAFSSPQIVVVGAPGHDAGASNRGAVYVFRNVNPGGPDQWIQDVKLVPSDLDVGAELGSSVSVEALASGHRIAVGAPRDNPCNALFPCGSAYVYDYTAAGASLDQKFWRTGTVSYGQSVAVAGSYLTVGGTEFIGGTGHGRAWVLRESGGAWGSVSTLAPSDAPIGGFGSAVSMTSTHLAVGAFAHDGGATNAGAAYVFERVGTNSWVERVRYLGATASGELGRSIDIFLKPVGGHHLIVGEPGADGAYEVSSSSSTWGPLSPIPPFDGAAGVEYGRSVATGAYPAYFIGAPEDSSAELLAGAIYVGDTATNMLISGKHLASSRVEGMALGGSLAADGDVAVVGAPGESYVGDSSGAAYVWERTGSTWTQTERLTAGPQSQRLAGFGVATAVSGDTIAVGARTEGVATGSLFAGAVHVFRDTGSGWSREVHLADASPFHELGTAVALEGDRLAAGAPRNGTGVVHTYERSGTTWTPGPLLSPVGGGNSDRFGASLAMAGDLLVVGAPEESIMLSDSGAAHVFVRTGSTWTHARRLTSTNPAAGELFGSAVAVDAERVVVGAPGNDANGMNAGALYVFRRSGPTSWVFEFAGLPSGGTPGGGFGSSVALRGNRIVAGAPGDSTFGTSAGALHQLRWAGFSWTHEGVLPPVDLAAGDFRGRTCAFAGSTLLAGASGRDWNGLEAVGAFQEFDVPLGTELYCQGKPNSLGCTPFLVFNGTPSETDTTPFEIHAFSAIAGESGLLLYSFSKANVSFHGGKLCVKAPFTRLLPPKSAPPFGPPPCDGLLTRNFNKAIQSGADPLLTAGQRVFAQWYQRDPADPSGFGDSLTDGVAFSVCP